MQNTASEASSHLYQDPALNDAALQEMLEMIDSSKLGKQSIIYNTPRINIFDV